MQQQEMEKKKEKKSILTANQKSDAARQEEQTTAVRLSDRPNGQKRFGGVLPVWGGQRSPERLVLTAAGQAASEGVHTAALPPNRTVGVEPHWPPHPPNASSPSASIHIPLQEPPSQQEPGPNPSDQAPPTEQSGGWVGQSRWRAGGGSGQSLRPCPRPLFNTCPQKTNQRAALRAILACECRDLLWLSL